MTLREQIAERFWDYYKMALIPEYRIPFNELWDGDFKETSYNFADSILKLNEERVREILDKERFNIKGTTWTGNCYTIEYNLDNQKLAHKIVEGEK